MRLDVAGLCLAAPAQAGLFADDGARKQIQQLEARVLSLEDALKQQTQSMLDLQGQIEALNSEIRKLRGQNEEIAHGLQDAEKRQKDFYVDMDTRLRHFESAEEAAREAAAKEVVPVAVPSAPVPAATASIDPHDPFMENRAIENAYSVFKSGSHADAAKAFREFIGKYPDSVHVPNATYWLGEAQFAQKEFKGALGTFQGLLKDFSGAAKAADTYFYIAECQRALKQKDEARKTLKQLVAKYPDSEAAAKAKKLLATSK